MGAAVIGRGSLCEGRWGPNWPLGAASPLRLDLYTNNCHSNQNEGGDHAKKRAKIEVKTKEATGAGTVSSYCSAPIGIFAGVQRAARGRLPGHPGRNLLCDRIG